MAGSGDPVATGLVQSLARPGGNVTGVAAMGPELAAKSIELLRELRPGLHRLGVLAHATDSFTPAMLDAVAPAAAALGIELQIERVAAPGEYPSGFERWRRQRAEAVFVQPSLPGAPAAALALQQNTRFDLLINLRTARALGIAGRAGSMRRLQRRRLLAALAGMAAGARAQEPAKAWRIGFLSTGAPPRPGAFSAAEAVMVGLRGHGHARLQSRAWFADGQVDRLPALAQQLLQWQPDLIVTQLTPAAVAAAHATRSLPIVMAGAADPVEAGLVQSLARPGGNLTGVASLGPELAAKVVELMHEMRPGLRRLAVLAQANNPSTPAQLDSIGRAAARLGLQLHIERVQDAAQFEAAFRAWQAQRIDAVFIQPSVAQQPAIDLALRHGMAAASFNRGIADGGGLFAYAPNAQETARLAAAQADRILRGTPPAQLPVQQNTRFDLIVNLRTAGALGWKLPPAVLSRATEVLE